MDGSGSGKKPPKNPFGNMTAQQFISGWQLNIEKKKSAEAAKSGEESGASPVGKIRRKSSRMGGQGGLAEAAGGNMVLKDALANLISNYGKNQDEEKSEANANDTEAVAIFKKAFKVRL